MSGAKGYSALTLLACLLLAGCRPDDRLLYGEWRAISITENGDSLRLNPREVSFDFRPDQRYVFQSTLRYEEAGTWRYDEGYLFATDTTQPTNPERVVAIDSIYGDTMIMRMKAEAAERLVVLVREGAPPE